MKADRESTKKIPTQDELRTSLEKKERKELKECTFQPTNFIQRSSRLNEDREGNEIGARTPDELIKWGIDKEKRMAKKRVENAQIFDKECVFTPQLDKRSLELVIK